MTKARVLIAGLVIALLGTACGNSESAGPVSHIDGALRWGMMPAELPRSIKVGSEVGYCVGDPLPSIKRPHIRYRGENIYIKLEKYVPRKKGHPKTGGICLSKGLFIKRKITLRKDLADVKIYDSGYNPPQLVWPED